MPMPQGWEWLIILAIGLLLFGKRLPEVGKSLGKGIVEFKKGIKGIDDEIEKESSKPSTPAAARPAQISEGERRPSLETPPPSAAAAPKASQAEGSANMPSGTPMEAVR